MLDFNKKDNLNQCMNNTDSSEMKTFILELEINGNVITREHKGYDYFIEEDEKMLYICADKKLNQGIIGYNLKHVISISVANGGVLSLSEFE